jgi:DNA polymerase I
MPLIFDIETNGFLDQTTTIHNLVIKDTEGGSVCVFRNDNAQEGVALLEFATKNHNFIVAHNGIKFDIPALQKLFPWFQPDMNYVRDTLVMSRLMFPDLLDHDLKLIAKGKLPQRLLKKHSLEAWGYRLGEQKMEYDGGFEAWSQEMEDYCVQDVLTLEKLYLFLESQKYPQYPVELEHQVAQIIWRQEQYGFLFDQEKARALHCKLVAHKLALEDKLKVVFHPKYLRTGKTKIPKADNKRYGYLKEAAFTPIKITEFNPGSRDHVAMWFKSRFNWVPSEFTNDGKPKIDDTILNQLPWPEAKLLAEYYMVTKRLGQVAEGDQAWFRHVKSDGRIHGGVITNGAVTGRMTHAAPNMAQVPAGYSPYGKECRDLFTVPKGKVLVGADASALELRCLAGYMAKWDNGDYIKTVVEGRKEDGTEIHTVNRKALQIDSRDDAKTWFYAFIYGAGDEKLGSILTKKQGTAAIKAGKNSRKAFLQNLPALGEFVKAVQAKVKTTKMLKGLDGRWLHIRSQHSALNTLLQSAGAILMKVALVELDKMLQSKGYIAGVNYEFVANVHDEWQIECDESIAESVGLCAVAAMEKAGTVLNFRCPITGEYRSGSSWAETH